MQYKTIVLELIRQQRELHQQLVGSKTLLSTMDRYAVLLKSIHEEFTTQHPGSPQAMEMAAGR